MTLQITVKLHVSAQYVWSNVCKQRCNILQDYLGLLLPLFSREFPMRILVLLSLKPSAFLLVMVIDVILSTAGRSKLHQWLNPGFVWVQEPARNSGFLFPSIACEASPRVYVDD